MAPLSSRHRAVFKSISPITLYLSPLAANAGLSDIIWTENCVEEEVDDVVATSTGSVHPSRKGDTEFVDLLLRFCSADK